MFMLMSKNTQNAYQKTMGGTSAAWRKHKPYKRPICTVKFLTTNVQYRFSLQRTHGHGYLAASGCTESSKMQPKPT